MGRSREPFLWALFSTGGMLTALVLPVLVFILWVAAPMGWAGPVAYTDLVALAQQPIVRLVLFLLIVLALFHSAHRFRYTLYDGLQLYHLNQLIAIVTYGTATLLTFVAAYVVWTV